MPSPFPGMDPFLVKAEWEDFHSRFNNVMADMLAERVAPQYVVRVERRVYVERGDGTGDEYRRPDVAVLVAQEPAVTWPTTVPSRPFTECRLPMSIERRETYLVIRETESLEVVTVLETLSPANKRRGGAGRLQYLDKREEVLRSPAHLVELDLLRGGERLPMESPLPPGDYYAIVSRRYRRPTAEVHAWTIREPLPTIPVPLRRAEPDVPLDLQAAFTTVYDRARYDLTLDYTQPLTPPLTEADREWLASRVATPPSQ